MVWAKPTCLAGEIPVGVLAQDLGENQQAVERGPELVRHVGQELGLVLGDEGELLRLLLQRHLGLLHLLVLLLHLGLLAGQQVGLFLQLQVGLLQLVLLVPEQVLRFLQRAGLLLQPLVGLGQRLLLGLEALGERLRLLEQLLGPHVGFDGVEHDADALRQLLQEGEPDLVELVEGRQLEHRLDLAFEEHRQHHDAAGRRPAQAGADLDVVLRNLVDDQHPSLDRALPHQAFAQPELAGDVLAVVVGVAGQQLEGRPPRPTASTT